MIATKQILFPLLTKIGLGLSGVSQATLIDRGGGLIYDDVLDITWLQDANYAKTSGYDTDGRMSWPAANIWADQLVYGGYNDWRLPNVSPVNGLSFKYETGFDGSSDLGFFISSKNSEMGYMHYVNLANDGWFKGENLLSDCAGYGPEYCLVNRGLFDNLESKKYWAGVEYALNPSHAWRFYPA
jgi:hypothetical protein